MARVFMLLSVIFISVYVTEQAYFLQEDFINNINEQVTTWEAGVNFNPDTPEDHIKKLLGSKGVQIPNKNNIHMYKTDDIAYGRTGGKIPRTFDARKKWPQCDTIGKVRDQGNCGSCWAMSTSSAFSDRLCIATDGDFNELLSVDDLTFCCHTCGYKCNGGYPIKAWKQFSRHGIVTGGDYDSGEGCQPYRVPPSNDGGNSTSKTYNHFCRRKCHGDNQNITYGNDHRYTRDYYYLTYNTIQQDVLTYGPLEASFEVFDDFLSYKSGVYVQSPNATHLGGHSVKLIGWGVENGIPYWLMVNSWNTQWGDNGLFKIRRGTDECSVDNSTTAGVPYHINLY